MTNDLPAPASCAEPAGEASFVRRPVDHPDAAWLLAAFYQEQQGRYGFADSVDLAPHEYLPPNGFFFVAYRHSRPVGCGGCRWYDRETATVELKKTFVAPGARGRGIGNALLTCLEDAAVASGARRVILETGVRNTAALQLFTKFGYEPAERYVPGT
ncbi:GNAT family N-acetyltransferase [Dactylosporangium sp. NPDC051485]|uniref:GNAT family N-acetyltransferase n=1 Tax=Dactylosporangium sp. NPDC051485 TaxID=3154846 RepID=UPI00344337A7